MLRFSLLDKNEFANLAKNIFDILAENMSTIAPTGNSYEEDYIFWFEAVGNGLKRESRQIILIHFDDNLIGFFQYYIVDQLFMMEEVQISPAFHKKENIFRSLFEYIFSVLPCNIEWVEAYANKKNNDSQGILQHLGLEQIGENNGGNNYHYRGKFTSLVKWYDSQ